jgi:hypothetical protein
VLDVYINVVDHEKLDRILKEMTKMIAELETLKTQVTDLKTVNDSVVGLLTLIKQKLDDMAQNATDLATLKQGVLEVSQEIDQEKQDLAAAVVANTPAE